MRESSLMWDWKALFCEKTETFPLVEQNLKHFCSDDMSDEEHKLQSDEIVRKWLRDCSDDLTVIHNTNTVREEIDSSAASIPCIDQNGLDYRNLKLEHRKSISKFDVTEDLSRLSRTGTEHERTPVVPAEPPKVFIQEKISCFSFFRRK